LSTEVAQQIGRDVAVGARPPAARRFPRISLIWVPVLPFFLFVTFFLLLPSLSIITGAIQDESGHYTGQYVRTLFDPAYRDAYWQSIKISVATSLTGGIFGLLVAYAAVKEGAPRWIPPYRKAETDRTGPECSPIRRPKPRGCR